MAERHERRLTVLVIMLGVVVTMLSFGLVLTTISKQVETSSPNPYEIRVPGIVAEENADGERVARNGRVRLITERCNTTDAPVVLDITTSWLRTDHDVTVIPGSPLAGITVAPGGSFCDPPTADPITSGIELPADVTTGVWQYQSQIVVSSCLDYAEDPEVPTRFVCHEVGPVLDHVGWFSEPFIVGADNGAP